MEANKANKVTHDLLTHLSDKSTCDFSLIFPDGKKIDVHSQIVSARSPMFQAMFASDMKEKKTGTMEVKDADFDVVEAMVHYIYTGVVKLLNESELKELLKIGHKYQINNLVDDCSVELVPDASNVLELGSFADFHEAQILVRKCAQFVARNPAVLDTLSWKEELKPHPGFLVSIIEYLKVKAVIVDTKEVEISRFATYKEELALWRGKKRTDAISFEINRQAILSGVGLFGNHSEESISVKITVKKVGSSSVIYSHYTSYESNRLALPIKIPIHAKLESGFKYTIGAVLGSGEWYYGTNPHNLVGNSVKTTDGFEVEFSNSDDSTDETCIKWGNIPALYFKVC